MSVKLEIKTIQSFWENLKLWSFSSTLKASFIFSEYTQTVWGPKILFNKISLGALYEPFELFLGFLKIKYFFPQKYLGKLI